MVDGGSVRNFYVLISSSVVLRRCRFDARMSAPVRRRVFFCTNNILVDNDNLRCVGARPASAEYIARSDCAVHRTAHGRRRQPIA